LSTCKLIIRDEINIKFEKLPVEVRRKISNKLKFELPYARHMPQFKLGRWDGTTTFFGLGGNGYLNHLDVILPILDAHNITISEIEDLRHPHKFSFQKVNENYWADLGKVWPVGHMLAGQPVVIRDDQVDTINCFLNNPQSVHELATGYGKTVICATLSAVCEQYGKTLIIVPNKNLVVQTEEDYRNLGLDVGVYYGDRKEIGKKHTIITWQSLNALDKRSVNFETAELAEFLNGIVCVIVDECHSAKGNVLHNLLTKNITNAPIRWGLTGTVPKLDIEFNYLLSAVGQVANRIAASELQESGILSKCNITINQLIDYKEFKTYSEENHYLTTDKDRMQFISHQCDLISQTGNTLILVNKIESGKLLNTYIPNSVFLSGKDKLKERTTQYEEMREVDDKVIIATYGIAAVGLNINRIFNLVLLEPGKSFVRVIQSIGRGLRIASDKDQVEIYDFASTCKWSKRHLSERKKYYNDAKYKFKINKVDWRK